MREPHRRNWLTDAQVRSVKPTNKPKKLFDGAGLYLLVNPDGARYWRFKYRFQRREKGISLGVYPEVSLQLARVRRADARRLVAKGIDPSEQRKAEAALMVVPPRKADTDKDGLPLGYGDGPQGTVVERSSPSAFEQWFIAQHGARPHPEAGTDGDLVHQIAVGQWARTVLDQRHAWDACHTSALWAWQAR